MIRLVVFDLDGTLVDSQQDLANSANALVRELGGRDLPDADVVAMVGEGAAVLVRRVLSAAGLAPETSAALPRFLELYEERLVENTVAYAGIPAVLDELRIRAPLAVLTNKPQQVTDRLLAALDLSQHFARTIGGDTALGRKPAPDGLLRLCAAASASPEQAGTRWRFRYRFGNCTPCRDRDHPGELRVRLPLR